MLVRYQFRLPADVTGAVTVTAKVNYRHLRQSYLNNIFGKDHPAYPVVEIASRTRVLKIGENEPERRSRRQSRTGCAGTISASRCSTSSSMRSRSLPLLRWSSCATTTSTAIPTSASPRSPGRSTTRPAQPFAKRSRLDPNNARALYYDGLLQRRAGNTEQEIADFRKVVEMFPQSRDARRELGITYYQQNDNHAALEQFEALQKIDPDDLTAHYNLSILYRRMGKPKEAAEQQAMFIDKKVDPGAPTYSLDFLRVHPEISTESIPWHMHSDLVNEGGAGANGK